MDQCNRMIRAVWLCANLLTLIYTCQAREIRIPLSVSHTDEAGLLKQPVTSYYTSIDVGTPPKPFKVQFDVDFNALFVPHTLNFREKISSKELHNEIGYNKEGSKTGTKEGKDVHKIPYGQCNIEGKGYSDKMSIHGQSGLDIEQRFIAAKFANCHKFLPLPVDGFFGLPRGVTIQSPSLLDNLGVKEFSFRFGTNQNNSELVLGGYGPSPTKPVVWFDLAKDEPNSWAIDLKGIELGRLEVPDLASNSKLVVSTGDSDIYGPEKAVKYIRSELALQEKKGLFMLNCDQVDKMSGHRLTFKLANGNTLSIGVKQWIKKLKPNKVSPDETCYLAVHPLPGSSNKWFVGTNFLSSFRTLFDLTKKRVGFSELN